jgi:hypothetical protein
VLISKKRNTKANSPLISIPNSTGSGQLQPNDSVSKISSDEGIADRPLKRHFNGVVVSVMGFMVLFVLLAMLFLHFKKSTNPVPTGDPSSQSPAQAKQPQ